ncbi:MAG: DUF2378 family protein [Myxococcaceae bacterium]|nr:DUF2378 family protein [Myxococcaceae bacterium]
MPKIRGSAFIPRINYLKANHADTWPAVSKSVTPQTRELLDVHPLATGWYPFETFVDLMQVADRICGAGDLELVSKLGHQAATANLSTVLRIFIRLGSPDYILGKASKVWNMYHDSGRAETESLGPRSIAFQVHDFAAPHEVLCVTLRGWVRAYLEATGCKAVVVRETKCRRHGGDRCRYEGQWL